VSFLIDDFFLVVYTQDIILRYNNMEEKILDILGQHSKRFDQIDNRFDAVDKKLLEHDDRFDASDVRMDAMTDVILENKASVEDIRHRVEKLEELPQREYWDKMYAMLEENTRMLRDGDVESAMIKHGLKRVSDKVEEHDADIRMLKEKVGS